MKKFNWEVSGTGADKRTWKVASSVEIEPGNFGMIFDYVMQEVFQQLTEGRAVYGQPGLGCAGPYSVKRVLIEEVEA